ncbi:hypothetical protein SAMN05444156_0322 [Verrucomicrobium sp. GAS474]|uniref:hypothetical protein n=1 Tax=Verrucomicrobium sp. GAS474 TaxID=1882831 RepID=UPI00087A941D|nr:hypothetical protein [Verrucomicrobium sp. GAS474]SDT87572.1 hypothetical protein SAMN05444156_0322 [Verrucomicrobium sp. GAS474]
MNSLSVGEVLEGDWSDRPMRVLMFDEVEVFYDSWWPYKSSWGFTSLKKRISYYRTSTATFLARSKSLRIEPFTDAEREAHRADLPLRLCRSARFQWSSQAFKTFEDFSQAVKSAAPMFHSNVSKADLPISKIALCPVGPKGSSKRGVLVETKKQVGFSYLELLWHAHTIQSSYVRESKIGVGLYRLGLQGGVPSYYVWGSQSQAGNLKDTLAI